LVIWIFPIAHCLLPNALFLSKPVAGSINFSLLKKYFLLSLRGAIATKQSKKMRDNRGKKGTVPFTSMTGLVMSVNRHPAAADAACRYVNSSAEMK